MLYHALVQTACVHRGMMTRASGKQSWARGGGAGGVMRDTAHVLERPSSSFCMVGILLVPARASHALERADGTSTERPLAGLGGEYEGQGG